MKIWNKNNQIFSRRFHRFAVSIAMACFGILAVPYRTANAQDATKERIANLIVDQVGDVKPYAYDRAFQFSYQLGSLKPDLENILPDLELGEEWSGVYSPTGMYGGFYGAGGYGGA
ncbi:MAG: hypothetical protein AB8B50_11345, partial [Pirellulaceae bacterium]